MSEWISVKERLPEDEKQVAVCYHFGNDKMRFFSILCYFVFDPEPHWQHQGTEGMEVTHWMPLPELPEQKEE